MYTSEFIDLGGNTIHYLKTGTGSKLLIAFHGYGLDAFTFQPLMPLLQNQYTILSIDLPHHGNTVWRDALFTKHLLVKLITKIIEKFHVKKKLTSKTRNNFNAH